MQVIVRSICGKYAEAEVSEVHSGTLNKNEMKDLALNFLNAAEDLLFLAEEQEISDKITNISIMTSLSMGRD